MVKVTPKSPPSISMDTIRLCLEKAFQALEVQFPTLKESGQLNPLRQTLETYSEKADGIPVKTFLRGLLPDLQTFCSRYGAGPASQTIKSGLTTKKLGSTKITQTVIECFMSQAEITKLPAMLRAGIGMHVMLEIINKIISGDLSLDNEKRR